MENFSPVKRDGGVLCGGEGRSRDPSLAASALVGLPPQYVSAVSNLKHFKVSKDGVATFALELELKHPDSRIFLYKVRLEGR